MRNVFILSIFLLTTTALKAQNDTIILSGEESYERIERDLDNLVNTWYVNLALRGAAMEYSADTSALEYPDSVYISRLSKINSIIEMPYNSIIRNHIHVYTIRQREKFCAVLGLVDYYFPLFEDIFDSYELPVELMYMSIIESALNPNAVSRAQATGLWQFMHSTARMYGLTMNSIVDERRDPIKSTDAAARYLRDLYKIYDDWVLALAAYNCGPGNVNKAIRRSGNKKDYWDIYYRLPRETRGYIPQFIAAVYAVNYHKEHNLNPLPVNFPIASDTIMVNKDIHLSQISEIMGIPLGEIRALNPQYRTGLIPGSSKSYALTLPMTHIGDFIDLNDSIRDYKADVYIKRTTQIANPTQSSAFQPTNVNGRTRLTYTVKSGDNLGFISEWYRVGLSSLREWNNIYGNTIRVGQRLVIYVDPQQSEYFSKVDSMTFTEKQNMKGKAIPTNARPAAAAQPVTDGGYIVHVVRRGDTIWDIVKMYENVTSTEILALNNISDPSKIQVGQRLRIKKTD